MDTNPTFEKLTERLNTVADLIGASSILGWDRQVIMPPAAAAIRGEQLATLSCLRHGADAAPETRNRREALRSYEASLAPGSDEASLIRVARHDYEKLVRVPGELRAEMSRAANDGY